MTNCDQRHRRASWIPHTHSHIRVSPILQRLIPSVVHLEVENIFEVQRSSKHLSQKGFICPY